MTTTPFRPFPARPRFLRTLLMIGAALGFGAAVPGCFSLKEPPCAFSCLQAPHRCPDQYTCQSDGLCHRSGVATGVCKLTAPADGGALDPDSADGAESGAAPDGDPAGGDGGG